MAAEHLTDSVVGSDAEEPWRPKPRPSSHIRSWLVRSPHSPMATGAPWAGHALDLLEGHIEVGVADVEQVLIVHPASNEAFRNGNCRTEATTASRPRERHSATERGDKSTPV